MSFDSLILTIKNGQRKGEKGYNLVRVAKVAVIPQEMISEQDRLKQKIPGFKFNLGFSGRGFKQGDDEEDEGDMALIKYADKFTWFGHLYDHEQPHKRTYAEIVKSLKKNEEFAKVSA